MIAMHFNVDDLLEILIKNREKHAKQAKDAVENYKVLLREVLQRKVDQLDNGKVPDHRFNLATPFDYLDNYDEIIQMLQLTASKTISLTNDQFKCYAMDEWPLRKQFDSVSTSYKQL